MPSGHSRRRFLKRSAAAAAAACIEGTLPARLRGEGSALQPGVQLYMVNREMQKDTSGTLAQLATIGYRRVEPFVLGKEDVNGLKSAIQAAGLQCPSGHFGFGMEDTEKALDDANTLGVHYAISSVLLPRPILTGGGEAAFMQELNGLTRDDFSRMAQLANDIGAKARKRGLQYAYHNHNVEFRDCGQGETGYSILLKETDPELVKLEVDLGWMEVGGADPMQLLNASPDRVRLLHFKDFSVLKPPVTTLGTERQKQIVELGHGIVPFKPLVQRARELHIEHYIVDHDPPFYGKTALEAAKIDFDYLSGLLAS